MDRRLEFHQKLKAVMRDCDMTPHVYFQPPESIVMTYPCIVYKRNIGNTKYADNSPYTFTEGYDVTVIDKNPDSPLVRKLAMTFSKSRYSRGFIADNLNQDSFVIYY